MTQEETPPVVPQERLLFARNFRLARKRAGLKQIDVTRLTGMAQSFVSLVENGRSPLSVDNMATLANTVGVPLWKLLVP